MVGWVAFEVSLCFLLKFITVKNVMANVSFYVIAIDLAMRVKSHSLQYRKGMSPAGKVLIVDHHVKKYILFKQ